MSPGLTRLGRYAVPLALVAGGTAVSRLVDASISVTALVLAAAVVVSALVGLGPSVVAAVSGALAFSYFIAEPIGSFRVDAAEEVEALVAFVVVGLGVASLVRRADQQRARAEQRTIELLAARESEAEARSAEAEARAQAAEGRAREAFFAAAGHNLRTPLTTLKTAASTLLECGDVLAPEDRHLLRKTMVDETDRLIHLVNRVLEAGRAHAGAIELTPQTIDAAELVGVTLRRLGPAASRVTWRVEVAGPPPALVGDPVLLGELLLVLVENAAAYAPAGSEVTVAGSGSDGGYLLAVIDHGPGIPAAERERVFEPFVRGDTAATQRAEGSSAGAGLGLAIARLLADRHGGWARARETPGGGATMEVWLPSEVPANVPAGGRGASR